MSHIVLVLNVKSNHLSVSDMKSKLLEHSVRVQTTTINPYKKKCFSRPTKNRPYRRKTSQMIIIIYEQTPASQYKTLGLILSPCS